jgi:ABC-type Zn uptake system ZnuABC Zn-binding protein ZnuA
VAAVCWACALVACGDDEAGDAPGPTVVASTTQVADLTRAVAGERADVVGVLAANSDPHEYEPRPSDAAAIADAGLVVRSGGDVDIWLDELVDSSGTEAAVLSLIDSVQTISAGDDTDPHWWQSPANAVVATEAIRDALIEVDPAGRETYEANAAAYGRELERLDRAIAGCIDSIPAPQRKLVTSHDSLAYFADRYGIDVVGATIPALTTQAQPSAGETAELIELIRDQEVAAVFGEAGVSTELEQAVADETQAEVGGELYADTLGPDGSQTATYVGAMRANAAAIAEGLGGDEAACELEA